MRTLEAALPILAALLEDLGTSIDDGSISNGEAFTAECRQRWDGGMEAHVDAVVPNWSTMATHADGKTLWHVLLAMVALRRLDEYGLATVRERNLME